MVALHHLLRRRGQLLHAGVLVARLVGDGAEEESHAEQERHPHQKVSVAPQRGFLLRVHDKDIDGAEDGSGDHRHAEPAADARDHECQEEEEKEVVGDLPREGDSESGEGDVSQGDRPAVAVATRPTGSRRRAASSSATGLPAPRPVATAVAGSPCPYSTRYAAAISTVQRVMTTRVQGFLSAVFRFLAHVGIQPGPPGQRSSHVNAELIC